MLTRSKLLLVALAAAATMLTFAADASARSFRFSEREFELLFREFQIGIAGNVISCPITLLGHFLERTVAKAGQVGSVRHGQPATGRIPPCTGGTIEILVETFPWRLNYASFTGSLPAIQKVRLSLIGASFRIDTGTFECLIATTSAKPAFGEVLADAVTGGVTGFRVDETARIPAGGSFLCAIAGEATFTSTGTVLNLPQNASLTVTLI